ncbi:MAG: hypothetical protein K0Q97_2629 [Bacillota bacterium]|jgi:flavodoxin|nr:hypothetical protein [Bacillota bacterium]
MKRIIVYESVCHGNTEKIAKVISEIIDAEMIKASKVKPKYLNYYDLIGFGSGIFYGKHNTNILDLISKMPNVTNKKAFVFSTSGQGKMEYNNYAKQMLRDKGFEVIGNFACKGFDTYGPFKLIGGIAKNRPNENDMEMAKYFARKFLVENISEI